ncbi:MAG TPA: hypothetical protein VFL94_04860 [Actinomycetales bacterium]|nr:hypothetical protein [Actinomycetales bacterium]
MDEAPVRGVDRLRQVVNVITLATPLGLLLARLGHAHLRPGPHGTRVAAGYRSGFPAPRASAVTIGDVILLRLDDEQLAERPRLLTHESRHSAQWASLLGVLGFPLAYGLASLWSWLRCRNMALRNVFEVRAGLADGGYQAPGPPRPPTRDIV